MCGRFTLASDAVALREAFPEIEFPPLQELAPRYNIAPSQDIAVVPNSGTYQVEFFRWGLIPSWAKEHKIGYRLINARAETLATKPSFRLAYRRRRCLILADGFYEWQDRPGKKKRPMYVRLASGKPFAFAGLWEIWHAADNEAIRSCTIITTRPNALLEPIHNRMPVILSPESYRRWLDPEERSPDELNGLLKPFDGEEMIAYPVSTLVNNPRIDSPVCVEPRG